ncbi:MAG: hypothetical protein J6S57_00220 [Alphaproteobacteria bacterium]|nr:hypothetical protein [Alphaproteobacteria bacterium]
MAKDKVDVFFCCAIFILGLVIVLDGYQEANFLHKYDHFNPIKNLSQYEKNLVRGVHDSVLDMRIARYDSLVKDYKYAFDDMIHKKTGLFRAYTTFNSANVFPKYANQIGADCIAGYSKYVNKYVRDSITPVYRDVYKNSVVPYIRNNTNSNTK